MLISSPSAPLIKTVTKILNILSSLIFSNARYKYTQDSWIGFFFPKITASSNPHLINSMINRMIHGQFFVRGSSSTIGNAIFSLSLSLRCTQKQSLLILSAFSRLHIHLITENSTYLFTDLTISILVCFLLFNIPSGNE